MTEQDPQELKDRVIEALRNAGILDLQADVEAHAVAEPDSWCISFYSVVVEAK